jgi:enolase-phosphatase E1
MLLDIEGTTTPADFVYKTLFPYAARKLESFLQEHFQEPEVQRLVGDLRSQQEHDVREGLRPPAWSGEIDAERLRSAVEYARWLMAHDSKCAALKALQGKIWQEGYARGELRGEVYPDVPAAFGGWRTEGRTIAIYSSGSELAQRLLFGTVVSGDLTPYIARYFDTRVGAKTERESYHRIAAELGHAPAEFLFVSDVAKEIEAAAAAGMQVRLCVREAGTSASTSRYPVIHSFAQLP